MKGITPFLWFDGDAEEAVRFYTSVFRGAKTGAVTRYGPEGPGPKGSVMTATFTIGGQEFVALNGGPQFQFTPAISFVVNCETQEEIDDYWEKLAAGGGEHIECGWLRDRFGVSWQIVPAGLGELIGGDPGRSRRVMAALMKMTKLDLRVLQEAARG